MATHYRPFQLRFTRSFVRLIVSLLAFTFAFSLTSHSAKALAATRYVDGNLGANCTSSNYSIANRDCSGTDGNAYQTVSEGVSATAAGDTLYIRGGNYTTASISMSYNSALTTTFSSYNNETVNISKSTIIAPIFALSSSTRNLVFYGLNLSGNIYNVVSGPWTDLGNNVWSTTLSVVSVPSQIRFNTTSGTQVNSQAEVDSANEWYWTSNTLYVYSTSDPATAYTSPGINQTDNFNAIGIGQASGNAGNLITIDNCMFTNFSHAGVKGGYRFHIKNSRFDNIGTDGNDHDVYMTGVQTDGNEAIIEYSYLGYTPGAALHLYSNPSNIIVRYNIINGLSGSNRNAWGILLSGNNIEVYNNTIYGNATGLSFYSSNSHHNLVYNNIFYNNSSRDIEIDSQGGASKPVNNTVSYNYYGSTSKCAGCSDQSGSGGDNYTLYIAQPPNILSTTNPFSVTSPDSFDDFHLSNGSSLANQGLTLSSGNAQGLDPRDTSWPLTTLDQGVLGSGWDLGAYVYFEDSGAPSITLDPITPNPTTLTDATLTGTAVETVGTVSSVEYQVDDTTGSWDSCTADDGAFDEASEAFTCSLTGLSVASHTIYVRAEDDNGNVTDSGSYATETLDVESVPVPSPEPSTNSNSPSPASSVVDTSCTTPTPGAAPELFELRATSTSVNLYFSPVNDATGYNIYYGEKSLGEFAMSFNTSVNGVVEVAVHDLKPSTSYQFQAQAVNGCAAGPAGNSLSITTPRSITGSIRSYLHGTVNQARTVLSPSRSATPSTVKPSSAPNTALPSPSNSAQPVAPQAQPTVRPTSVPQRTASPTPQPSSAPKRCIWFICF